MNSGSMAQIVSSSLLWRQNRQQNGGNGLAGVSGRRHFKHHLTTQAIFRANRALGIYLGVIFLAYCIAVLFACPTPELAGAVCVEVLIFSTSITLLRARSFKFQSIHLPLPGWFSRIVAYVNRFFIVLQSANLVALIIATTLVTIDCTAFASAMFGSTPVTTTLYCIPGSQLLGLRPAASLEMLAGAYVDHKDFAKAEKLYMDILDVRTHVFGLNSGPVGALYADLGDLNVRQGNFEKAEYWYRRSIARSETAGGPAPTGRALTGLATVLRKRGHLPESEQCYLKALSIRARMYGIESKQYADTLHAYEQLLLLK